MKVTGDLDARATSQPYSRMLLGEPKLSGKGKITMRKVLSRMRDPLRRHAAQELEAIRHHRHLHDNRAVKSGSMEIDLMDTMILVGEVVCSFELLSGMFEIHGPALLDAIEHSHVGEMNTMQSGMQSFPGVSSNNPTRGVGKRALSPPPPSPPRQRAYSPPPP